MGFDLSALFIDVTTLPHDGYGDSLPIYLKHFSMLAFWFMYVFSLRINASSPISIKFPGFFQLLFLGGAYAYILCYASNMISDGSELLLLIPSVAGLVGSVVLPVLGAVPDGAIVLFSGIGPDAQEQLTIGIGALAGSTIMLLTAPWFLSVLGGRVNIVDGKASYTSPKLYDPEKNPKESLPTFFSWTDTGVDVSENVNTGGLLMAVTAIPFLII